MTDSTVFVTTRDMEVGLARRECSVCRALLLIRLPSMAEAIADRQSQALLMGFDHLTLMERALFDLVYASYPRAVGKPHVMQALQDMPRTALTQHVHRIRKKLVLLGWQLIQRHNTLRLVAPE